MIRDDKPKISERKNHLCVNASIWFQWIFLTHILDNNNYTITQLGSTLKQKL